MKQNQCWPQKTRLSRGFRGSPKESLNRNSKWMKVLNEHDDDRVDSTTGEEDGAVRSVSSLCHGMRAWGKFEPSFQAALLAMPTCHFAKYGMDYWTSATRAGLAPLPISDEKMRKVSCHLAERGKRAAAREGIMSQAVV